METEFAAPWLKPFRLLRGKSATAGDAGGWIAHQGKDFM
jgi:hypothetical protein